jgi:glutamate formiminotransferase
MKKIVECVPNFSEGKRKNVIDSIAKAIESTNDVKLLDVQMDKDHNRSVITFIGIPQAVEKAAFKAVKKATESIDLRKHKGEHPRLGATDVIPFVPISNITMDECVIIAKRLGKEIAEKLKIPIYLYEAAATRPDRANLADIRKGEFEGLSKEIGKNPDRKPDFGEAKMHPSAGATVIGAREPLIAYNINLGTNNLEIAKKIASTIRHKDGGFRYVKALGFEIKERGIVQVSMNLVNYKKSPIFRVFEMVRLEAERYGVPIVGSEIVGLVPLEALVDSVDYYLRLENFNKSQIMETRLWE